MQATHPCHCPDFRPIRSPLQPSVNGHVHNHALFQDNPFLHDIYKIEDERLVVPVVVYPRHRLLWYCLLEYLPFQ
jgi:hypothetical protein